MCVVGRRAPRCVAVGAGVVALLTLLAAAAPALAATGAAGTPDQPAGSLSTQADRTGVAAADVRGRARPVAPLLGGVRGLDGGAWARLATVPLALWLLVLFVWAVVRVLRGAPPGRPRWQPRRPRLWRPDALMIAILSVALLIRLWIAAVSPVTGDEATNIEAGFWTNWFLAPESRSSPPLFRMLIHLTSTSPERLWLMRLPALVFGVLGVGLVARLGRELGGHRGALLGAAVTAFHQMHVFYSVEQKSYTLWLCSLVLGHLALRHALAGDRRGWAWYGLWALLASLTHYLTVLYLVGQLVGVARHRRADLAALCQALLPAALALAPHAVPVLMIDLDIIDGDGLGSGLGWWAIAGFHGLIYGGGLVALLFVAATRTGPAPVVAGGAAAAAVIGGLATASSDRSAAPRPSDPILASMCVAGTVGALLLGAFSSVQAHMFFPLLPLTACWAIGRLPLDAPFGHRTTRWALGAAAVVMALVFSVANALVLGPVKPALGHECAALIDAWQALDVTPAAHVVTHTGYHNLIFGVTGHRDLAHRSCSSRTSAHIAHHDGIWFLSLRRGAGPEQLDVLLARLGSFDFLHFEEQHYDSMVTFGEERLVRRWLVDHCRSLVSVPGSLATGYRLSGAAHRCGGPGRGPVDNLCERLPDW